MGARAEGGIRVRGAEICIAPDDHAALERLKYGESRGEEGGMRSAVMCVRYACIVATCHYVDSKHTSIQDGTAKDVHRPVLRALWRNFPLQEI